MEKNITPDYLELMTNGLAYLLSLVMEPAGLKSESKPLLSAFDGAKEGLHFNSVAYKQDSKTTAAGIKSALEREFERLSWTCDVQVYVEAVWELGDEAESSGVMIALTF